MKLNLRSIAGFSLLAMGMSVAGTAMAVVPTKVAIFQCNLFTFIPFNVQTFDKNTNSSISLPGGSLNSCATLLEQLEFLGLTGISVSYTSTSNGTAGNYETFTLSDGTVGGI